MKLSWIFLYVICLTNSLFSSDIAVVTLAHGKDYQDLVKLGIENKRNYCQKHGYDFIYSEEYPDPSRSIYWAKILLVLKTLKNPSYKWVIWMDADTLVMNQDIRLEDLIDDNYHFLISEDWNSINTGVFFAKNIEWSRQFFIQVYLRYDCLSHICPEQTAVSRVLSEHKEFGAYAKIYPQRIFNSYPIESCDSLIHTYQPGDFIIHFASIHDQRLKELFNKYSRMTVDDHKLFSLEQYLGCYGFKLASARSNTLEENLFNEPWIQQKLPQIQNILEIGLNEGLSTERIFQNCQNIQKYVSLDLNQHPYIQPTVEYFKRIYKNRFEFIPGDSTELMPLYTELHPEQTFDLIRIHEKDSSKGFMVDLINCQKHAHPNTILWIGDSLFLKFAQNI